MNALKAADSHCHVHEALLPPTAGDDATDTAEHGTEEDRGDGWEQASVPAAVDACLDGVELAVTMGTRPLDWAAVAALASCRAATVWPAFGVHPWHAFRVAPPRADSTAAQPAWCTQLRRRLEAHPRAVVGEIGLDKVAKVPGTGAVDFAQQTAVFAWQLALAAELARPVSVHCVRAFGPLVAALQDAARAGRAPPAVAMHSYTGSADTVKQLLRLPPNTPVYFGFSACICLRSPDKAAAAIAAVPDDRLLLESDHADPLHVVDDLRTIAETVARVKGWALDATVARTTANALRWVTASPGG